jgi:hypothetical protein
MPPSPIENEVLRLRAATGSIDQLVTPSLFILRGTDPESSILFHSETEQRLFNILLVDLLNPMDVGLAGAGQSVLDGLGAICTTPHFDVGGSIASLRSTVDALKAWLDQEIIVSVHLSAISRTVDIKIKRREFIEVCGNISKHNFARLTRTASKVRGIFARNAFELVDHEDLLILDDFYERFHADILNYHGTAIVEMLNNVRWGIHEYLKPEYQRSYTSEGGDPPRYSFKYPASVTSAAAKTWYWELMNVIRAGPPVRRFVGTKWLKLRY